MVFFVFFFCFCGCVFLVGFLLPTLVAGRASLRPLSQLHHVVREHHERHGVPGQHHRVGLPDQRDHQLHAAHTQGGRGGGPQHHCSAGILFLLTWVILSSWIQMVHVGPLRIFLVLGAGTATFWYSISMLFRRVAPGSLGVSGRHFWNWSMSLHFFISLDTKFHASTTLFENKFLLVSSLHFFVKTSWPVFRVRICMNCHGFGNPGSGSGFAMEIRTGIYRYVVRTYKDKF